MEEVTLSKTIVSEKRCLLKSSSKHMYLEIVRMEKDQHGNIHRCIENGLGNQKRISISSYRSELATGNYNLRGEYSSSNLEYWTTDTVAY